MRTLRRLCAAFMLTLTLAFSAFAGDIETMITSPPPPQHSTTQATTQGDISTGSTGNISTIVTVTLNLLESMLSLF